ncbi:MAG: flagellar hook-basal body complex protein FliE [Brevirhabdus sp.]
MTDFAAIRSSVAVQNAYGKTRDMAADATGSTGTDKTTQAESFAQMVTNTAAGAVDTVRTGDATAIQGLTGQAGMQQVVEATMAMESTVRVSVAVRDKLVEAYQEIIRMPI